MTPNEKAFLDTISFSEGTYGKGDDGYNVLVGGSFFDGYDDHPRISVYLPSLNIHSTAAGRYQLLERYFDAYKGRCSGCRTSRRIRRTPLPGSRSRNAARSMIVNAGRFDDAVGKVRAYLGQPARRRLRPA